MVLTETGLAKVFQRVKSFVIAQLNSKASVLHTHTKSEITDFPTIPTKTSDLTNDSGFLTSHQDLSGYIPRTGGSVLTSDSLGRSVSTSRMVYCGGANNGNGASVTLYGKDSSDLAGVATIQAYNGTNNTYLRMFPTGEARYVNNGTTKNLAMQEDVIPRSGGSVLTGYSLSRINDVAFFELNGGSGWGYGASISLRGKDYNTNNEAGCFFVKASDSTKSKVLSGRPDGTLTWNGKNIDCVEEQGDGYIRYSNGIQICWVQGKQTDSVYTWNFPKTFLVSPVVTATIYYPSNDYNKYQRSVELNDLTSTGVLLRATIHLFGHNTYIDGYDYVNAIAIGRWK